MAVPEPSSTLVKSHEKLRGGSLDTGPRVVKGDEDGLVNSLWVVGELLKGMGKMLGEARERDVEQEKNIRCNLGK